MRHVDLTTQKSFEKAIVLTDVQHSPIVLAPNKYLWHMAKKVRGFHTKVLGLV